MDNMRNLIAIIFGCVIMTSAFAQRPKPMMLLNQHGFVGPDSISTYVVIEVPKLPKAEFYKKTLTYLNSIYKNPSRVITTVENESIIVNGFTEEIKGPISFYEYPTNYNIKIQFKDGKLRFEPKIVDLMS